jgi:hypothetical protein
MALNMLFYSYSRSLRKMQTQVGIFLHAAGAKDQIIRVFEEYGISIGVHSISKILEILAKRQQIKLRDIGKTLIDSPYNIVYDNINIHEKVGQQRGESQDTQFNGVCGFLTPTPGTLQLLEREAFSPKNVEGVTSLILLDNKETNAEYHEIVSHNCDII